MGIAIIQLLLDYIIFSLLNNMVFKTYNFGQINKFILLFKKKSLNNMFCKIKCALIMPFNTIIIKFH